jgi:hypothetical protein
VGWWPGEGDANDLTGTHPGTLQGGVTFAPGRVGRAFNFNGSSAYVDLGSWFNLQTFTISMWVKSGSSQGTYADIIDNNHTDYRSWVAQYQNTGSKYFWGLRQSGQSGVLFNLAPGSWQLLVLTRDTSFTDRVYLDGAMIGSDAGTSPITYDGTQFLRLILERPDGRGAGLRPRALGCRDPGALQRRDDGLSSGNRNSDSDTDRDGDAHTDNHPDNHADVDGDTNRDEHGHTDDDTDGDQYADDYGDAHEYRHADQHPDADGDSFGDTNTRRSHLELRTAWELF